MVVDRYRRKGAIIADSFTIVPDSCFVDRHWPTEHYNLEGKTIVAKNIQQIIVKSGLDK